MRGPAEDAGKEVTPSGEAGFAAEANGDRRKVAGGKPLLRLLQVLESSGYPGGANAALAAAVSDQGERDELTARLEVMGLAPTEGAGAPAAEEAEADPDLSTELAEEYLRVGERLGPPTATGPQWRSLGPWTIPNGQTYGSSRVNVSGRIASIAIDPSNPAHVLAGAANGGVWESFDRGGSWSPRTDFAATTTVGALAFSPQNPATVYCGTGEGNFWGYTPLGAGILRSVNGGTTWATLCTAPFVGQGFFDLVVDPRNANRLIAGTTGGLYVSNDGGSTWTRRRTTTCWTVSLAYGARARLEILAACADGLFRSTDAVTWTAVTLPTSPGAFDRLAGAIAPSDPTVAYAWGARGATPYLWRRAAGTWTAIGPPPGARTDQAWYDWFLAVSPDRPGQIYCGEIEVHRGDLSGTTWAWRNLTNKGSSGQSIHPDQHAIAFEPGQPNTVYIGNDGGLYRSGDRGVTFTHCNNGLVITEFEYLAQDFGSARWLIGGTQDNGTERWTGSQVWDHVQDGDGGDCGVNRTDPRTVFHSFFNMTPERSTARGNFGSWAGIAPPVPMNEGSLFYPPFECSHTSGTTIAMGGGALYVSRNNGTNWTRLAYPSGGTGSAMFIPTADQVVVGLTDGRVLRTTWSGTAWSALTALTTPRAGAWVSDLFVDPSNLNRLWATSTRIGGGRVFSSDNGGVTWDDRSAGGLPALPINAIAVDPWNANRAWVAADLGVYETTDGGRTWRDFSSALPNALVGDLLFQPHARVLRAATRNRGVWEIPVDGWMTQPQCGVQFTGSLAGNASGRWFTFNWPATWHLLWTVMPTSPRPGAPQIRLTVEVERASAEFVTYWLNVQNLTPDRVTFEGRWCLLSRY